MEERTVARRSMAVPDIRGTYIDDKGAKATVRHLRGDRWIIEDAIGEAEFNFEDMRYFLKIRRYVRKGK